MHLVKLDPPLAGPPCSGPPGPPCSGPPCSGPPGPPCSGPPGSGPIVCTYRKVHSKHSVRTKKHTTCVVYVYHKCSVRTTCQKSSPAVKKSKNRHHGGKKWLFLTFQKNVRPEPEISFVSQAYCTACFSTSSHFWGCFMRTFFCRKLNSTE